MAAEVLVGTVGLPALNVLANRDVHHGIAKALEALLARQQADGHWVFELEADATIPADYVLLQHYLGDIDPARERAMGAYLRAGRTAGGGWPLFYGGEFDLSTTVKAYFALNAIGDDITVSTHGNGV